MKIEIEYDEVARIRKYNEDLLKENERLQKELKSLKKDELRKSAMMFAVKMFEDYQNKVFKELGFEQSGFQNIEIDSLLLRKHFDKEICEPIKFTIGASVTNHYKKAFMRLGIDTDANNNL